MPLKEFLCKICGDINSECPFVDSHVDTDSQFDKSPTASGVPQQSSDNDLNLQILAELKILGGRMTATEQRMSETDPAKVFQRSQATVTTPATSFPVQLDQVVVLSVAALQGRHTSMWRVIDATSI